MAHSKIQGRASEDFPRYCLEVHSHKGDVWLSTGSVHPVALNFAMTPAQAREMAAALLNHAEQAEAAEAA